MVRKIFLCIVVVGFLLFITFLFKKTPSTKTAINKPVTSITSNPAENESLSISSMRKREYPGSNLVVEQTLSNGANYNRYIVSYASDGFKIYALFTVPTGQKPKNGWPVIIFNHGYIPPEQYSPTQRYVAYVDAFAKNGYLVLRPDYRGNGQSQGNPDGAYYSPSYATDVLNALSSIKKYKDANPQKIGMWGHSMGGNITLRSIVVNTKDIKAAVIWGGVVGSYYDLWYNWQRNVSYVPSLKELTLRNAFRQKLAQKYGDPKQNPSAWNFFDPTQYTSNITTPIQLDVGALDEEVPVIFSQSLYQNLLTHKKIAEYYSYPNGDHNISDPNFSLAMERSIIFFDKYLK